MSYTNSWKVKTVIVGETTYLQVTKDGKPGLIEIREGEECFTVSIYDDNENTNLIGETYAAYEELKKED